MSENTISSLPDWPEDAVAFDVVTPLAMLKHLAQQLKDRTKGLLQGQIINGIDGRTEVFDFCIVAPSLDNFQYKLFQISHRENLVYPVRVEAEVFTVDDWETTLASGQREFKALIERVLNSNDTKSVIQSLIARINDNTF